MPVSVAYAPDLEHALALLAPAEPHALCIGIDMTAATAADFTALADAIVASNPYYVCCWGPNCEKLHDWIDETVVLRDLDNDREHPLIMTTWHADEPLSEAVDFALRCTAIPSGWPNTPPAIRFLLVGNTVSEEALLAAIQPS